MSIPEKKKMSLGKKILLGFVGVIVLIVILSNLFPVDYYKDGMERYDKKDYKTAYEKLGKVKSDDPNYEKVAAILAEIKPKVDSLQAIEDKAAGKIVLTQAQKDSIAAAEKAAAIEERKKNTITAADLFYNYDQNEVKADEIFKDKTFYVTGVVATIAKDVLNDAYVTLETNNMVFKVQCILKDEKVGTQLNKGDKVTFYGVCKGKMMNILMHECELVENLE